MARSECVTYRDDHLHISGLGQPFKLASTRIRRILVCTLEDQLHHADEEFHIVLFDDECLVIGPFVAGGLGAIMDLRQHHPEISAVRHQAQGVPYRFREPSFLGLRWFPIPGLYVGPQADLRRWKLVPLKSDE